MSRRAGVLLHPTSLPGPYGMGDIGRSARQALEWIDEAGLRIWQMLPLHPTERRGSPYTSPSAFARNPLLLCVRDLVDDGWLLPAELPPTLGPGPVDFAAVTTAREAPLEAAADRVVAAVDLARWADSRSWVVGWARFAAIAAERGQDWTRWPEGLRAREPEAMQAETERLQAPIARAVALQWLFEQQWSQLRSNAHRRGIELWGDVPIFVGHHSADVWLDPGLFQLTSQGRPVVVSGCPPDPFAPTGQLWGHPLYDVPEHRASGFAWWLERLRVERELTDCLRLDHFRGLAGMWAVDYGATDASAGRWVEGLGAGLLDAVQDAFGEIPLYAEDLGIITPDVIVLRDQFGLRGMTVLQFAFGGQPDHAYLPHRHREHSVTCTGTHDTETTAGWLEALDPQTRHRVHSYLGGVTVQSVLRGAWRSRAAIALTPMQDLLGLGSEHRMNTPGTPDGNWRWRMAQTPSTTWTRQIRMELDRAERT